MEELTFEILYENLQKKLGNITEKELLKKNQTIDKILELDPEYREFKNNISYSDNDIQTKSKTFGNIEFNIYMLKKSYNNFEVDENYKVVDTPEKIYYETGMSISNNTKDAVYTIDNVLSLKDSDIDKVQTRYNYLSYILDNYTEQELLCLVNSKING